MWISTIDSFFKQHLCNFDIFKPMIHYFPFELVIDCHHSTNYWESIIWFLQLHGWRLSIFYHSLLKIDVKLDQNIFWGFFNKYKKYFYKNGVSELFSSPVSISCTYRGQFSLYVFFEEASSNLRKRSYLMVNGEYICCDPFC